MSRPWVVFFSQTGSEIANIAEKLGREPDLIITNKDPNRCEDVDERIDRLYHLSPKPSVEEYENVLDAFENPIISLHGYLRILPKEICEKYEIYNGHPGLITKYPELKGKDPQVRAWEGKYSTIGAVLHRVTAGVDEGPIHSWTEKSVNEFSLNETFRILREVSLGMWVNFLKKVL